MRLVALERLTAILKKQGFTNIVIKQSLVVNYIFRHIQQLYSNELQIHKPRCLGLIVNYILEEKKMGFMTQLQNELNNEKCLTTNGAVGYATSGKKLLDINFSVTSLRKQPESEIINKFMDAYYEDPILAMRWLFYARDCRQGIGERRLFRVVMKHLADVKPDIVRSVLKLVAEFGRWDDLLC